MWSVTRLPAGVSTKASLKPWWLLWSSLLCVSWIVPNHYPPWPAFETDFLVAVSTLLLAIGMVARHRHPWPVPAPAAAALLLVIVPIAQWAGGLMHFAGDAWICSVYLLGFALAVMTGSQAEARHPLIWVNAVFASTCVAAMLSVGLALYQWLRLTGLDPWAMEIGFASRPYANLGQPNMLATLLGWGLVSVWWFFLSAQIRGGIALVAAGFLLLGIAVAQSRTGWLFLSMTLVAAAVFRRPLDSARYWPSLVGLAVWFAALVMGWDALNEALHLKSAANLGDRLVAGTRFGHWQIMLSAIAERPIFGWGWNQVVVAQQAVATSVVSVPREIIDHSHNIALDLLVWNGLPLGGLVIFVTVGWLLHVGRRVAEPKAALLLIAILVLLCHALLEYPHTYAYMLLPVGMFAGTLSSLQLRGLGPTLPRGIVFTLLAVATTTLAWTVTEYVEASSNLQQLRLEKASIRTTQKSGLPDIVVLTQLRELLSVSRLKVPEDVNTVNLERMRKVAERYPSDAALIRYAMAAAFSGNLDEAHEVLRRFCKLRNEAACKSARISWEGTSAKHDALAGVSFPDP